MVRTSLKSAFDNGGMHDHATAADYNAFRAAKRASFSITTRIRAEVDYMIMVYEGPSCRAFFQNMQDRLPKELRDMVYEYILQGPLIILSMEDMDKEERTKLSPTGPFARRQYPYSYLLDPGYFTTGAVLRHELIEVWYRTSTFVVDDLKLIGISLQRCRTSMKPLKLIKQVDFRTSISEEELFLESMKSLLTLNMRTTITIYVDGLTGYLVSRFHQEDGPFAYLLPALLSLRSAGYTLNVRSEFGLNIVVEELGTTWQSWTRRGVELMAEMRKSRP
jgi:hypothetical protein